MDVNCPSVESCFFFIQSPAVRCVGSPEGFCPSIQVGESLYQPCRNREDIHCHLLQQQEEVAYLRHGGGGGGRRGDLHLIRPHRHGGRAIKLLRRAVSSKLTSPRLTFTEDLISKLLVNLFSSCPTCKGEPRVYCLGRFF